MFKKKKIYILFLVVFTLILCADIVLHFTEPSQSYTGQSFPTNDTAGLDASAMPEDFDASAMPEDFDASAMPEDFDASAMPEDFDASAMPEDFDASAMPEDFDASAMPEDFDASAMPESFDPSAMGEDFAAMRGDAASQSGLSTFLTGIRSVWLPIMIFCLAGDCVCAYMLWHISRRAKASALPEIEEDKETAPAAAAEEQQTDKTKKRRKRRVFRIIALCLLLLIIAGLIVLPRFFGTDVSSAVVVERVLTATAESGAITSRISGTGTLSDNNSVSVTVPGDVKITGYAVENGDFVEEGDAIAYTDKTSVMKTIVEVQETIDELDDEIYSLSEDTSSTVTAAAAGRVVAIYAKSGESVLDTMYTNSALMLISLDGLMAVDINSGELSIGESVVVTYTDGSTVTGMVAHIENGVAVITADDEYGALKELVTVKSADGETLGAGELYIHSELKVTGVSGTVSAVWVSVGSSVSKGQTLFTLTDLDGAGARASLLNKRSKLEEQMSQLFKMNQNGCISAESDGFVSGIDVEASYNELAAEKDGGELDLLISEAAGGFTFLADYTAAGARLELLAYAPDNTDDSAYTHSAAKVTAVNFSSISVVTDNAPKALGTDFTSYEDLSTLDTSGFTSAFDISTAISSVCVYTYENGAWTAGTPADITVDDVLLFTYDSANTLVGVIRSPSATGGQGGQSGQGGSGMNSGISSGMSADGASGMTEATEEDSGYSIDDTTVFTFTPDGSAAISVTVDELDILSITVGQSAAVTLDALGGQSFDGVVCSVDKNGVNDGGSTKYTIVVTVPRTKDMLTGMNASVSVDIKSSEAVLILPVAALTELDGKTYVYTSYDKRKDTLGGMLEVSTGVSDGVNVEILSGIEEGTTVYYRYADTISYTFS